jgi:signal peptidase II
VEDGHPWCTQRVSLVYGLILGGAVGNVVDSAFYGVLLNNAPADSPTPWFHGQVIDMLYFPMFDFVWPQWVPFLGGRYFEFFSPVFNIADSSIFIGVVIILIMQRKFFKEKHEDVTPTSTVTETPENHVPGVPVAPPQENTSTL